MKIEDLRLVGIRCFDDTGTIKLHPNCNVFVGKNNAGKSTLLKAVLSLQGFPFGQVDMRPGSATSSFSTLTLSEIPPSTVFSVGTSLH